MEILMIIPRIVPSYKSLKSMNYYMSLSDLIRWIEDTVFLIEFLNAEDIPMLLDFLQIYTEILKEFLREIKS